ncbi:RICIN domain-containing protein [Kitasatospora sp. NPDC101155]|uniref:RICIN domain-containing protein n=1 Tax=Kitasatospora sp. NPDC101155 TaxID=3364097 RepID=UPI0037F70CD2
MRASLGKAGLRRRAMAAILLPALATAGLLAAPQQASASDCEGQSTPAGGNCTTALISSIFDTLRLAGNAAEIAKSDNARFTQSTASALAATAPGYNVMVFKYDGTDMWDTLMFHNSYDAKMNGVLVDTTVRLHHYFTPGTTDPSGYDDFRIWVFAGDSTFTNYGDGGYMNWSFVGQDDDQTKTRRGVCAHGVPCNYPYRVIHFPSRAVPGVPKGGGTPVPPGTPGTPGIPITPGVPKGGGTPIPPGTPGTPGIPAHGGKTIHPKVKNGNSPLITGTSAGSTVVAGDAANRNSGWELTPVGDGRYRITSAVSGLALTENTSSYLAETRPWTGADNQKWQLATASSGTVQISVTDQDCLTFDESAKPLGVWTCNGDWSQQWKLQ